MSKKIAAVLIAKNEEASIEKCLLAVAPFVDEIAVLDTGSTDDTIDIASRYARFVYTSKIFDKDTKPEDFHFANARNEAKAIVSEDIDYILSVDCDELCVGDPDKFRARVDSLNGTRGQQIVSVSDITRTRVPRLFDVKTAWVYRCHEVPDCAMSDGDEWNMPEEALVLRHERTKTIEESAARNLVLLLKQHEQDGHIGWTSFLIGETYIGLDKYFEAIGYLIAYSQSGQTKHWIVEARCHRLIALCWYHVGHLGNAKDAALQAIGRSPEQTDGYLILAAVLQKADRFQAAIHYLKMASKLAMPDPIHKVEKEAYDPAFFEKRIKEIEAAEEAAVQAMQARQKTQENTHG